MWLGTKRTKKWTASRWRREWEVKCKVTGWRTKQHSTLYVSVEVTKSEDPRFIHNENTKRCYVFRSTVIISYSEIFLINYQSPITLRVPVIFYNLCTSKLKSLPPYHSNICYLHCWDWTSIVKLINTQETGLLDLGIYKYPKTLGETLKF